MCFDASLVLSSALVVRLPLLLLLILKILLVPIHDGLIIIASGFHLISEL